MSNEETDSSLHNRAAPVTALAKVAPLEPWHDSQWQQLWLALESRQWRSLALVPAGEGGPADFTVELAVNLSRTGMVHVGNAIQIADATRVRLGELNAFLAEVRRYTNTGERLLVALPPAGTAPVTTSIAQAVDAAVLCVLLEEMASADAKRTLKSIGPSRFLGSVLIHPHQLGRSKQSR